MFSLIVIVMSLFTADVYGIWVLHESWDACNVYHVVVDSLLGDTVDKKKLCIFTCRLARLPLDKLLKQTLKKSVNTEPTRTML